MGWRLLEGPPAGAAWNMSVDEALLEAGASPPTLRLYRFLRPTLSLGFRQPAPDWLAVARSRGAEVVRRASGGGTVLHAGDLTYAVCVPRGNGCLPDELGASSCWIRERLVLALRACGLAARPARAAPGADRAELCFAAATGSEIELCSPAQAGSELEPGAAKLVGSAQRRKPWGLLQHGSIRLRDESALYEQLVGRAPGPPPMFQTPVPADTLARAIVASFEQAIGQPLERGELLPVERSLIAERQRTRASSELVAPRFVRRPGVPGAVSGAPVPPRGERRKRIARAARS